MEQATFTDPSDQSAWIYHRWLLSQSLKRYQDAQRSGVPQQDTAYQVGPLAAFTGPCTQEAHPQNWQLLGQALDRNKEAQHSGAAHQDSVANMLSYATRAANTSTCRLRLHLAF